MRPVPRCTLVLAAGAVLSAVALLLSCAHRIALPEQLKVSGIAELESKMRAAHSPLHSYSAEVRVTYFGPEGRVRTTGSIAVARPASLRYEVIGPHGGAVTAFATNGVELEALDMPTSRFRYGPATPKNVDRLLPFAPLDLAPAGWVKLLFGELDPSGDATFTYDDRSGHFVVRWAEGTAERLLEVDPASARVVHAEVFEGGVVISDVRIEERDSYGLPTSMHLLVKVPEKAELEVKLRDVEANPALEPSVFVLEAPAGIAPEHL